MRRALLPLLAVTLLALWASPLQAQLVYLQNDDFSGGAVLCYTGIDVINEAMAAKFTATPSQYPYTIDRIRVFGCGGGQDAYAFRIFHDDADTANPGTVIYTSVNAYFLSGSNTFNDILLSDEGAPPIVITSGTVRVELSYQPLFNFPIGFGADVSGIQAHRNFLRTNAGVWSFAENPPGNVAGDFVLRLGIVPPGAQPSLSVFDATVNEGNAGTTQAVFSVALSGGGAQTVTVDYATADGSATAGTDYQAASGNLSFAPGVSLRTVAVLVNGDVLDETNETFTFNLSNPQNAMIGDGQGVGTITDDDLPPSLSVGNAVVTEGNAGTTNASFTVSLSASSGQTVTASFTTADGTATAGSDYAAAAGTLTFTPGTTSQTVTVAVNGDLIDEPDESFFVNLTGATNATILDGQGLGTITDDDPPPALSIGDVTVAEGNAGTANASFTVTLSAPSGQAVAVSFATADGTATAPSDYTASSGTLSFAPGQTSGSVLVPVVGDVLDEPDEAFFVNLTGPLNATLGDGQGLGTITDDDPTPALSIGDVTVAEGNAGSANATFTVSLSGPSSQAVTVSFATADGTATAPSDYTASSGTLSLAPGAISGTILVPVVGDLVDEPNETFFVNLSSPQNASIADGQGLGTILDDDGAPSLSIGDVTLAEGNAGTTNASFTVTLAPASAQSVSVDFATADGTATAPGDYTAAAGTLSFGAGQTSGTVLVPVVGDASDEPDETFFVNLSNAQNAGIGDGQGLGTITNDDGSLSISIADATVVEGNAGTTDASFIVTLSAPGAQTVSVDFATADGTATAPDDYTASSGTLSFAPGETSGAVLVPAAGDLLDEPDETFLVNLSNAQNASIADGQGLGTITDDDGQPLLSVADTAVREGVNDATTAVSFAVSLSVPSGETVSVDFATADGTAASGTDYQAAFGTVSFAPGTSAATVDVTVYGDDLHEGDESFLVNLTAPVNAGLGDAQAAATILDDDAYPELTHGQILVADLRAQPGPAPDADVYRLSQKPYASYEVVVDGASGDLGASGPALERLASDGATVIQNSSPLGTGSSRSLRWENPSAGTVNGEYIRVRGTTCTTTCGPEDVYRIRLYETTAGIARFNNSATQVTVLALQNLTAGPVTGTLRFWSAAGAFLHPEPFFLVPHGTYVVNTSTLAGVGGQSGSITIAGDGVYGALAGKAVSVEPATGFTFDSPLVLRAR